MIKAIAENAKYSIKIDPVKNRLYMTLMGQWGDPKELPNFVNDVRNGVAGLAKGFTCLADMKQWKTPSPEAGKLMEESVAVMAKAGVGKSAGVFGGDVIAQQAAERRARDHELQNRKPFADAAAAEAWLDSKE